LCERRILMRKAVLAILLRLSLVIALGASAALFVEYQRAGDPAFCGVGSGCLAVRMSPYSKLVLGETAIPLPTLGIAAFGGLLLFALFARGKVHHQMLAALAGLGGAVAVYLIYLQAAAIGVFCKWCMMVDASAIVAGVAAGALYAQIADDAKQEAELAAFSALPRPLVAWTAAALLAVGLPFVWAQHPVIPPLPPEIQALQVPDKITIVSFTDFECPFCRGLHPTIDEIVHQNEGKVVLLRKMMPLSGHPGAMPAALAYECAPGDKVQEMADLLYGASEELLNREGLVNLAVSRLGVDRRQFSRCMTEPSVQKRVDDDMALFAAIKGPALPLTYVAQRAILGFNAPLLREAVAQAGGPERKGLPVAWMLALLGAVLAAASAYSAQQAARAGLISR
jgi:uncharacterized membrane protein/thiol-disulfide isomerase/thioredoxin